MKGFTTFIIVCAGICSIIFGYLQYKSINDNLNKMNDSLDQTKNKINPILQKIDNII